MRAARKAKKKAEAVSLVRPGTARAHVYPHSGNGVGTVGIPRLRRRIERLKVSPPGLVWRLAELEFLPGGRLDWVPVRYDSGQPSRYKSPHSVQVQLNEHFLTEDVWQGFMNLPRGAATRLPAGGSCGAPRP